ncbi:unnamed protein product [Phytomonas sp. Hart1]|nr:unnamed protein product [Phytomonas sp. Hart1]|eukprot:CCW70232.1 unnamed protein product [Phytomonas sp. isolate Hart1]
MPGHHGKQKIRKKKSKRAPVTEMERTLKDSIHGRKRKERTILKDLIPPRITPKHSKVTLSTNLPMFTSLSSTLSKGSDSIPKPSPSKSSPSSSKVT